MTLVQVTKTATKSATKPAKQRKALYQAPEHRRHKLMASPLSAELRASQGVKTIPVRSGDTVRVMRGDHKGFEGKISRVDHAKYRIYVEGLTREKVDGSTIFAPVHSSKVVITRLNLEDKWRKKILERKQKAPKRAARAEEKVAKPAEEAMEAREKPAKEELAPTEKVKERKPRKPRKRASEKPTKKKAEKEAKMKEKPKARKPKAKPKAAKKTEGGT